MLKFYADESFDDSTSLMNLSGYLVTESQFCELDARIKAARGDLPYFHMKEGHHREHPEIYQELVSLVRPTTVICGASVSFFRREFDKLISTKAHGRPLRYWFGGEYTYALGAMMALCADYLNQSAYRTEYVAYVFESHPKQGDANAFWNMLSQPHYDKRREDYHYASHSFVDGKGPLGSVLQICDILAWNLNKMQREKRKSPELNRLFQTPTIYRHHDPNEIAKAINLSLDRWEKVDKKGRPIQR